MKSQRDLLKWFAISFFLAMLLGFALVLPSASAQEENTPTPTETSTASTPVPTEIPSEEIPIPTFTPTPMAEPEESAPPFSVQGAEQSVPSSTDWSAPLNISVTDSDSRKPSIAADSNGGVHIVWVERKIGEPEEIYYKYWNGTAWSTPINVSNSSVFYSNDPQVAADSSGRAYITWQEQDDDYTGDAEILYSQCAEGVCTAPVSLSGPPNWDCGRYYPNLQDWHSQVPILGIDQAGRLMVEWRAYEPGELTMPYSTWLNTGTPPSVRTGCVPSGAGVYNRSVGSSRIAGGLPGDFRLLFEEARTDGAAGIYYSRYSSAHWTSSYLAQGHWPDVFLDTSNQAHGTWCGTDGKLRYWNSATFITETILDVTCNWHSPIAIDASGLPRVFWNQAGQIYGSTRLPEGWSERVNISRSTSGTAWPDVAVDANGNLHLVWYDGRDGNFEIYYSTTSPFNYDCSGTTLSHIGQAVFDKVEQQEYCGNRYDGLITLPPGRAAFERFQDLAIEAKHEIDFTTMIWDEQGSGAGGSPGRIFLEGVKELYNKVQANPENYPGGVRVRILVGLRKIVFNGYRDQRVYVMRDIKDLEIEFEDTNWKVEVALYRDGDGDPTGLFGTHSHVKLMVVDGKKVVTGGYNMQNDYLNPGTRQDMGMEVSGPIATRALMVFDELWMEASRCDVYFFYKCLQEETITDTSHDPAIIIPTTVGNDVVFSLFRDDTNKTADNAIEAAINAANSNVNIIQNRFMNDFWYPPQYARAILNVLEKGDGQVTVKLLVSGSDKYFLDDLALTTAGICQLKDQLLNEDPIGTHHLTARFSSGDKPIHTKALSIDGFFIIVGSQNFDPSAWGENIRDSYDELGDLAEYSLGIDSTIAASEFNNKFDEKFAPENGTNDITCPYNTFFQPPLQNVINQAPSGSVIFIPAGVYIESVTINKPLVLVGAGANQTIIQPEGNQPAFRVTSSNVAILNMRVSRGAGYGIELVDSSPSSLKDIQINRVVFENNAQGGVLAQGLIPGSPMNYAIENNTFIGGADGVTINMIETQAKTSFIRNNIFFGQSEAPIDILSADDSRVEYSYNLFDDCYLGACATYWRLGNMSASSSEHDNLFDLDPLFSSPENGAYQLSFGSPAIDSGDPGLLHDLFWDGDNDGIIRIDLGAFEYMPIANVSPVVNAGNDQTIELGNSVTVNAFYSDADNSEDHSARIDWGDGIIEDVPTNMTGPGAGEVTGQHTYASPGSYTVMVCVVDIHGGVGCDTLSARVLYSFTGFFPPVDNQPSLNVVKAGSAIPIKFSLDGYQGLNIFTAGYPASAMVTCGLSAEDAIEQTATAGASSLSYDAATDQFIYVWKTDKSWAGTCRTFVLKLNDGSYHRADFKFKK